MGGLSNQDIQKLAERTIRQLDDATVKHEAAAAKHEAAAAELRNELAQLPARVKAGVSQALAQWPSQDFSDGKGGAVSLLVKPKV